MLAYDVSSKKPVPRTVALASRGWDVEQQEAATAAKEHRFASQKAFQPHR